VSTDEIKLDYELAEAMAKTFKAGAEQIEAVMQEMEAVAATLEGGALLGRGGAGFTEALRTKLVTSLDHLRAKFVELEGDVHAAISSMREADETSRGKFG